ncbi:hypothetical protein [Methylomonas sp. 11b]|nr:hypothetical protein [Methylomonas sp. 11b]
MLVKNALHRRDGYREVFLAASVAWSTVNTLLTQEKAKQIQFVA